MKSTNNVIRHSKTFGDSGVVLPHPNPYQPLLNPY